MTLQERLQSDKRIVYGARCGWWDSIDKVGHRGGLPCCPHCSGVLFELPTEDAWWSGVDGYEKSGHPGYRKFVEWVRGKCYPNFATGAIDYRKETGQDVQL